MTTKIERRIKIKYRVRNKISDVYKRQHNIELRPGQGAALVRSAGNFAQLTSREGKYCVIKLPSGEVRQILSTCLLYTSEPDYFCSQAWW